MHHGAVRDEQAGPSPTAPDPLRPAWAGHDQAGAENSVRANRRWWEASAVDYLAEHGDFLGGERGERFVWCPEGLDEAEAGLLGPVAGRRVLEIGCGAGQCSRWLSEQGAQAVGLDLSAGMLTAGMLSAGRLTAAVPAERSPRGGPGWVHGDARRLPFADSSFDLACSAFGAIPFVADPHLVMKEVARVLRPEGKFVFSVTHPIRWAFPDDPGPAGLTASHSYFDRTPYIERDADGKLCYAEHHSTLGQRIRDLTRAGLVLLDLVEPRWPAGHERVWGGWSPLRGRYLPGTAIFVARRPAD
ncbi:MAG: class SAM-dependent methyltransferase [Actinomycetota bacterium]|nr:class SAM-dependent methyltransferase [Actinomycetota bacterium]